MGGVNKKKSQSKSKRDGRPPKQPKEPKKAALPREDEITALPQERIAAVRPFWKELTATERADLLKLNVDELRERAELLTERFQKQAAQEIAEAEARGEELVPLASEITLTESLDVGIERLRTDKGTWKVWEWPAEEGQEVLKFYDGESFRTYLLNNQLDPEKRDLLPRDPPGVKPVEKPAEAALRQRMAKLLATVQAHNRQVQEELQPQRRPRARRGDVEPVVGRDPNAELITTMLAALEKEHEFLYHAVLFPVTAFVCDVLSESSRESTRTELFYEDLERLPAEEVARICEWITEKVDSFASKLKPEAKDAEVEEEEEGIGDVDLFQLEEGPPCQLAVHSKWLGHLSERQLGEDGHPRKVGVKEDPTGMGLVLEWVYGSIVSTAEKARDGAKRTLGFGFAGGRSATARSAYEALTAALREQHTWTQRAAQAKELLAAMLTSRRTAAKLALEHDIRPQPPPPPEGETVEPLPDSFIMAMLTRESLLTQAKLHGLVYDQLMDERKLRSLKTQLRKGEPEFDRLKRELEDVKNAPRGLEGTFRSAAEMERHRAAAADAAIEEQLEVQTSFRQHGARLQGIYDNRQRLEVEMAKREQELKQLQGWRSTIQSLLERFQEHSAAAEKAAADETSQSDDAVVEPAGTEGAPQMNGHDPATTSSSSSSPAEQASQEQALQKLRTHFQRDVRKQLYTDEDDRNFFQWIQSERKAVEERLAAGAAVLQHLEMTLVNSACDDPGAVIGCQLALPLLQERLDGLALQHATKKAAEAEAAIVRMDEERRKRDAAAREKKAQAKSKLKGKARTDKERAAAEKLAAAAAAQAAEEQAEAAREAAAEAERQRRAEASRAAREEEDRIMEARRSELLRDEHSHWSKRMAAEAAASAQLAATQAGLLQASKAPASAGKRGRPTNFALDSGPTTEEETARAREFASGKMTGSNKRGSEHIGHRQPSKSTAGVGRRRSGHGGAIGPTIAFHPAGHSSDTSDGARRGDGRSSPQLHSARFPRRGGEASEKLERGRTPPLPPNRHHTPPPPNDRAPQPNGFLPNGVKKVSAPGKPPANGGGKDGRGTQFITPPAASAQPPVHQPPVANASHSNHAPSPQTVLVVPLPPPAVNSKPPTPQPPQPTAVDPSAADTNEISTQPPAQQPVPQEQSAARGPNCAQQPPVPQQPKLLQRPSQTQLSSPTRQLSNNTLPAYVPTQPHHPNHQQQARGPAGNAPNCLQHVDGTQRPQHHQTGAQQPPPHVAYGAHVAPPVGNELPHQHAQAPLQGQSYHPNMHQQPPPAYQHPGTQHMVPSFQGGSPRSRHSMPGQPLPFILMNGQGTMPAPSHQQYVDGHMTLPPPMIATGYQQSQPIQAQPMANPGSSYVPHPGALPAAMVHHAQQQPPPRQHDGYNGMAPNDSSHYVQHGPQQGAAYPYQPHQQQYNQHQQQQQPQYPQQQYLAYHHQQQQQQQQQQQHQQAVIGDRYPQQPGQHSRVAAETVGSRDSQLVPAATQVHPAEWEGNDTMQAEQPQQSQLSLPVSAGGREARAESAGEPVQPGTPPLPQDGVKKSSISGGVSAVSTGAASQAQVDPTHATNSSISSSGPPQAPATPTRRATLRAAAQPFVPRLDAPAFVPMSAMAKHSASARLAGATPAATASPGRRQVNGSEIAIARSQHIPQAMPQPEQDHSQQGVCQRSTPEPSGESNGGSDERQWSGSEASSQSHFSGQKPMQQPQQPVGAQLGPPAKQLPMDGVNGNLPPAQLRLQKARASQQLPRTDSSSSQTQWIQQQQARPQQQGQPQQVVVVPAATDQGRIGHDSNLVVSPSVVRRGYQTQQQAAQQGRLEQPETAPQYSGTSAVDLRSLDSAEGQDKVRHTASQPALSTSSVTAAPGSSRLGVQGDKGSEEQLPGTGAVAPPRWSAVAARSGSALSAGHGGTGRVETSTARPLHNTSNGQLNRASLQAPSSTAALPHSAGGSDRGSSSSLAAMTTKRNAAQRLRADSNGSVGGASPTKSGTLVQRGGGMSWDDLQADTQRLILVRGLTSESGQNNCFLNVIIQSLWHLPCFRAAILQGGHISPQAPLEDRRVADALVNIFRAFATQPNEGVPGTASDMEPKATDSPTTPSSVHSGGSWAVSPWELRDALGALGDGAFNVSDMHDAAEVFAQMFACLHRAEAGVTDRTWDPQLPRRVPAGNHVAAHSAGGTHDTAHTNGHVDSADARASSMVRRLFGLEVQSPCPVDYQEPGSAPSQLQMPHQKQPPCPRKAGMTKAANSGGHSSGDGDISSTHVLRYFKYYHLVPAQGLRLAYDTLLDGSFEDMLRAADASDVLISRTAGGVADISTRVPDLTLLRVPRVFTLALVWDSPQAPADAIASTVAALQTTVDVAAVFAGDQSKSQNSTRIHHLRCVVAYSGHHYQAYAMSEEVNRWLLFDDTNIRLIGSWADVKTSLRTARHQPSLLFYDADPV